MPPTIVPLVDLAWRFETGGSIISVAMTPAGSLIAAACVDRTVSLISSRGELQWRADVDEEAWAVAITDDGQRIAVGTASKNPSRGSIYIFDRLGRQLIHTSLDAPVWSLSFSGPDQKLIATTWGNTLCCLEVTDGFYRVASSVQLGSAGLYGVSAAPDGKSLVVSAYDDDLYLLDSELGIRRSFGARTGLYNCVHTGTGIIAGGRDGRFLVVRDPIAGAAEWSTRISARPICAVAASNDLAVVCAGSFDGRVYAATPGGEVLWTFEADGEIWSTAMSADGGLVAVGSGDHSVYLLKSACKSSLMAELAALELALTSDDNYAAITDFAALCLHNGLAAYGATRLASITGDPDVGTGAAIQLLTDALQISGPNPGLHSTLGGLLRKSERLTEAAHHFQAAAATPSHRMRGLVEAGGCFAALGLDTAALSCFRRAREPYLDRDALRVLYNLARSYEDGGVIDEARTIYEVILSWQIPYRNAYERYLQLAPVTPPPTKAPAKPIDYTGLTVSLLGPDAPRSNEVAAKLASVIKARASELALPQSERRALAAAVDTWARHNSAVGTAFGTLGYDTASYLRYDYLPPEDEIKKQLEMVQLLAIVASIDTLPRTAVDIGAATGRHPTQLAALGINAIGVDIEIEAMVYATRKAQGQTAHRPRYVVADVVMLPCLSGTVDLVTCMMGTFAHLEEEKQVPALTEMARVLAPGGTVVISTWDVECYHQSYLSMYSERQKEKIRLNSLTQRAAAELLESCGFVDVQVKPFGLVPNVLSYDLGHSELSQRDLYRLLEVDLAARALFPAMHGEMFIVTGRTHRGQTDQRLA